VKISSCGEQPVISDEEKYVSDNSNMQYGIWSESGTMRPHFSFTGKTGINIDLEDHSNSLECFVFCTPETEEVIVRETYWYVQKC
jgi:uncharacterized protein affecting Mg2+/Co2+ transport